MSRSILVVAPLAVLLCAPAVLAAAPAADPLSLPPFGAEPAALLEYAKALTPPEDAPGDFLLHETVIQLDEQGRRTWTLRLVYRPLSAEAARKLGTTSSVWSPWYEEKPQLDTRVITADGQVYRLDQATIGESPLDESAPDLYDDRRRVRAPIPGIAEGSVVEEVIVSKETAPFFAAGTTSTVTVDLPGPVRRARVVVEAPEKLPLRFNLRGSTAKPKRTVAGGRTRLEVDLGRVEWADEPEDLSPRAFTPVPAFSFSVGESWKSVGAAYGKVVEQQLAGAQLKQLAQETIAGATDRRVIAERLLGWVRKNIRYTGVHFGEAKIVPRAPAETLSRRFGDCKDMSTLLVGLLREAGLPAHVALVRTRGEIEASLPGLGGFNHAIVFVPGKQPLWIDPTDGDSALGSLPQSVQGTRALVTGTGADALMQIPGPDPRENRLRIVREYRLEEQGAGRVVETREAHGIIASFYRGNRPEDPKERFENAESYGKSVFGAEKLEDYDAQPDGDTTDPYRARYVLSGCSRAATDNTSATAWVSPAPILTLMPEVLLEHDDDGPVKRPEGWRKQPMVLPCPFVAEVEYRVVPPPGFAAKALPAESTRKVGGATYTERFVTEPDGTVVARYGFDTGPGVYDPAQVKQLAELLGGLAAANDFGFEFELKAATLEAAGRRREAFEEYRRLIELHPAEARHRNQYASALLEAGLGEAARAQARKAVQLEPKSADAHSALGTVLQHDLLGRWMAPGFDHAGALAAFRQARKLDPKHFIAQASIAYLLEFDERGRRYSPDARLDEAIAEYRALHELEPEDDDLLLILLTKTGRVSELRDEARKAVVTERRNIALVAATAALDGVPAAAAEAAKLVPDPKARRELLASAIDYLVQLRRYPEAAAMARQAAVGSPNAYALQARAASLERVRRFEELKLDPRKPENLPKLFYKILLPQVTEAEGATLFSANAKKPAAGFKADALAVFRDADRISQPVADLPLAAFVDLAVGVMEVRVEGDEKTGWHVTSVSPTGNARTEWYLVREDGALKILASQEPEVLVAEAKRRLEAGDLAAAKQWLKWARRDKLEPTCPGEDEKTTLRRAIARFQADSDDPRQTSEAIPVLTEAIACEEGKARRADLALLSEALSIAGKGTALLALAEKELADDPDRVVWAKNRAFLLLKRMEERTALLRAHPDSHFARVLLRKELLEDGDFAGAEPLARRQIAEGRGNVADAYNDLAWAAAFAPAVTEQALDDGRRAVSMSNERVRPCLHTLATLYAQSGRPDEAMQLLVKSVEVTGKRPEDDDWYVVGRAAEEYGLTDEARRLYRLVEKPKRPSATSTWHLAQRRLAALGEGGQQ
jgi:tetratricopeptide (TPR) repeat protein/transglutaminase-like putative cysteine protease